MIVSAHQPNFFPWLGYFDKMQKADLFILVDHVQFERQSFQNRTQILTAEGPRWITVPVNQRSRDERILEKTVDNSRTGRFRWGRKMFLTMKQTYQTAPHFNFYEASLLELLDHDWERLLDLNLQLIDFSRKALNIQTPMISSSELNNKGTKSEMVLNMCREVGADAYMAGEGASKNYLDVEAFKRAGIKIIWQKFKHPRYPQHIANGAFVENLSTLDLLFNRGPESAALIKNSAMAAIA